MDRITRTVTTNLYTLLCYNDETNEVEQVHFGTTKNFRTDKAEENFLRKNMLSGFTYIRTISVEPKKIKYSMDLDTFIQNAEKIN